MKEINLIDYKQDVERLITYIPWLESKNGASVSKKYDDKLESTISFPVFDSTLLNFVNEASKTSLMDKNYVYVYSHYFIKTVDDEKKAIENADLKSCDILIGILSKYVLGGMTKGTLWPEAVSNGIFLEVLKKMKKLLEIWDAPLA